MGLLNDHARSTWPMDLLDEPKRQRQRRSADKLPFPLSDVSVSNAPQSRSLGVPDLDPENGHFRWAIGYRSPMTGGGTLLSFGTIELNCASANGGHSLAPSPNEEDWPLLD